MARSVVVSLARDVDGAISRAQMCLESRQRADGLWHDFPRLRGGSTDWVTAVVTRSLLELGVVTRSLERALEALGRRQRSNGGWSYGDGIPTDCDSTAWALQARCLASLDGSANRRASTYLLRRQAATGGFPTYARADGMHVFMDDRPFAEMAGWTGDHTCVSAVVLEALAYARMPPDDGAIARAAAFLLRRRDVSGVWRSYWWRGVGYGTYHAMKALSLVRAIGETDQVTATGALLRNANRDGSWSLEGDVKSSPFETALSLLALLLRPDSRLLRASKRAARWLVAAQRSDGSWGGDPILRFPKPHVVDPAGSPNASVLVADDSRVFTTATALRALAVFRSMV